MTLPGSLGYFCCMDGDGVSGEPNVINGPGLGTDETRVRPPLDPRLPPMATTASGGSIYRGGLPAELRPAATRKLGTKVRDGRLFAGKMRKLADQPAVTRALRSILCDPDHDQFMRALEFVTERGYGRVPQRVEGEHVHRHAVVVLPALDPAHVRAVAHPPTLAGPIGPQIASVPMGSLLAGPMSPPLTSTQADSSAPSSLLSPASGQDPTASRDAAGRSPATEDRAQVDPHKPRMDRTDTERASGGAYLGDSEPDHV